MSDMLDLDSTPWNVVRLHDDARKELMAGLSVVAEAVGSTLGPRGRCVLIQSPGKSPIVTKDGVTVSKSINLRDPAQRAGAELIREAASRTADVAGDGTTTSTVLAYSLAREGLKAMDRNFNANAVKRGIDAAVESIVSELKLMSKPVSSDDELRQIATISANGDSFIGGLIADAIKKVGKTGIVTVDDAKGSSTSLEFVEGLQFGSGWMNAYFVTHPEKMQCILEDTYVLLTDRKISALKDLVPILEAIHKSQKPLLIVAEDVEGEALQGLILNKMKAGLKVCAVKAPGWGSVRQAFLQDLAALTGAQVISSATGTSLEKATLQDLGRAKRASVDKLSTTIVGNAGNEAGVQARVKELQTQLEDPSLTADDRSMLLERVGKLTSGAAIIKVGGMTEIEVREKRDRVDDAICATRAAMEEGIVPGGGIALLIASKRASASLKFDVKGTDEAKGVDIVLAACEAPLRKIAENAGARPDVIISKVTEALNGTTGSQFWGWNAARDEYEDLLKAGVIDPVKVSRTALQNAASVAGIFLTLDAAVLEDVSRAT